MRVKKIIVYYNNEKKHACELAERIKLILKRKKVGCELVVSDSKKRAEGDFAVSLGGDGTMLKVSHILAGSNVPLLGINMGSLGFLAEADSSELGRVIEHILRGEIVTARRMLLEVSVIKSARKAAVFEAFNDCVVKSAEESRLISVSVRVNNSLLSTYHGDGVIVSTPTGSTAYSLAAGGPIVYPGLDSFIIAPICPHMLTQRPIILPDDFRIELKANSTKRQRKFIVSMDGQRDVVLGPADRVVVGKSHKSILIATLPGSDYFEILRKKLNWGER